MNKPSNEANFLIEITPRLHDRIKRELGDAYTDNYGLHYSPYWEMMDKPEKDETVDLPINNKTEGEHEDE